MRRGFDFWLGVTALVPLAYVSITAGSGGPAPLLGCGGLGPGPPTGISYISVLADGPLPVGVDGFFPFAVGYVGMSADAAVDLIVVEVRNEDAVLVPGTVQRLDIQDYLLVGWQSSAPLGAGEQLVASLAGSNQDGMVTASAMLTVRNEVATVELPDAELGNWMLQTIDSGDAATCQGSTTPCGPMTLTFGRETELVHQGTLTVDWPTPPVMTAWAFEIAALEGNGELVENTFTGPLLVSADGSGFMLPLRFRRPAREDLCVVATVRDLRTDYEVSEEFCSTPADTLTHVSEDRIRMCATVPPEFQERWCRASAAVAPGGSSSVGAGGCRSVMPPGGAAGVPTVAGSGGSSPKDVAGSAGLAQTAGAGAGALSDVGSGGDPRPAGGAANEAEEHESVVTRGCGCNVPARRSGYASLIALALVAAALGFRRTS